MNRKEFLQTTLGAGLCPLALFGLKILQPETAKAEEPEAEKSMAQMEKEFIENWLSDLLDTIEQEYGKEAKIKMIEGSGRGCFRRWQFKQDIAKAGKDNLDNLLAALKNNFEIWRDGNTVHIRYGETSPGCYCPVLKSFPHSTDDPHCNCTKAMHAAIWEAALGRPYPVEIVETVRRGGKTCHFTVQV